MKRPVYLGIYLVI